ncbi:DUF192 domain-containing protein [Idiomarina sp. HP20-50]|uniref:DUF192 domain-containing protein n=1 Tax=Idiomarina sp. HP20-50 TaxID=3070813 RepID=UPI00294AC083|nr:DUF192 domain-containing protein [Idiomarina sp. HP20-50]MDV6315436.1 DUF192 domain-containing protein [Idiomarina sp. HP20-50]
MSSDKEVVLWSKVKSMKKFHQRLIGMLKEKQPTTEMAFWFPFCKSIHTWGMKEPIDVVALDKEHRIIGIRRFVCPNEIVRFKGAYGLIEMAAGNFWPIEKWIGKELKFTRKHGELNEKVYFDYCIAIELT